MMKRPISLTAVAAYYWLAEAGNKNSNAGHGKQDLDAFWNENLSVLGVLAPEIMLMDKSSQKHASDIPIESSFNLDHESNNDLT